MKSVSFGVRRKRELDIKEIAKYLNFCLNNSFHRTIGFASNENLGKKNELNLTRVNVNGKFGNNKSESFRAKQKGLRKAEPKKTKLRLQSRRVCYVEETESYQS